MSANDTINIGVVGTGGRGTGACHDCLSANYGVRLIAMGDLRTESCVRARGALGELGEKVSVKDEHIYAGLDAYKRVFDHPDVDVVILTTSPGFRPVHLVEAVQAGKHVFAEKPVCVDPAGYRAVVEAGRLAKRNNTAIVTGTQYRRQPSYVEAIEHIHDGMIGRVTSAVSDYCSSGIWYRDRQPGMSDLEYQLYNWYHFVWLSGDQIAEQAVH
ncbi:MAG: Gfo/Idh/MocA family oxidoreductase, partial [Phycisphaerales bacterium]|nr:Gfo/Idh/MocA family oxidoreductase [Phycisphaerales bacterium]